jgi:hypothetical protein
VANGKRIELAIYEASFKNSDKNYKVSIIGYTSDKDKIEEVKKSLNEFIIAEID